MYVRVKIWITKQNMVFGYKCRPALLAMWSKPLPVTASYLSPSSRFESHPGDVRKLHH